MWKWNRKCFIFLDSSNFSNERGKQLMEFNNTDLVLALLYTSSLLFAVIVLFLALPTLYKGPRRPGK